MKTDHIFSLISRIRRKSHKLIISELEKRGVKGFVPSHGSIIDELFKKEPLSMQELVQAIDRDKSTVTALVDKLVKAGFVEKIKSENDNRITLVHLLPKGKRFGPAFDEISNLLIAKAYAGLTEWERDAVVGILEKMLRSWE